MSNRRVTRNCVWGGALLAGALSLYAVSAPRGTPPSKAPALEISDQFREQGRAGQKLVAAGEDRHHHELKNPGPADLGSFPPAPEHHVAVKDASERRKDLERARGLVGAAIDWLSQRRAEAERASRPQEVAMLTVRIKRLAPRLRILQGGGDPDEAPVSENPNLP